jgi:hypothetical protein
MSDYHENVPDPAPVENPSVTGEGGVVVGVAPTWDWNVHDHAEKVV